MNVDELNQSIRTNISKYCEGKVVLDNGCGDLQYTIAAMESKAKEVISLDVKIPEMNMHYKGGINFILGDSRRLPFQDNTFDIIICVGVIEYIPDYELALNEMLRVLKKDGIIIFQDKDSRGWRHKLHKFVRTIKRKEILGYPRKYSGLMAKIKEKFDVIDYSETKPKHLFLVVLKKKE
jgi:ubiquinone/menaquinone biosynthesis C-methylase UbiE